MNPFWTSADFLTKNLEFFLKLSLTLRAIYLNLSALISRLWSLDFDKYLVESWVFLGFTADESFHGDFCFHSDLVERLRLTGYTELQMLLLDTSKNFKCSRFAQKTTIFLLFARITDDFFSKISKGIFHNAHKKKKLQFNKMTRNFCSRAWYWWKL